jgi:hypothetical protein
MLLSTTSNHVARLAPASPARRCAALAPSPAPLATMAARRRADVSAAAASAENFEGAMLTPSVANKTAVRGIALAASVTAAAYLGAPSMQPAAAAFAHLIAVATFLGAAFYTTFFAGILMFKNLPRQTFGKLQSKLFPVYFWLLATTAGVAFATLAAATAGGASAAAATFGGQSLLAAVVGSLANALFLEPRATEVMFERYALENAAAASGGQRSEAQQAQVKALGKRFGALHGASSMANLVALCAMVAYTWQLAGRVVLV